MHLDADDIGHFTVPLTRLRSGSYKLHLLPAHKPENKVRPHSKMWVKVDIQWEGECAPAKKAPAAPVQAVAAAPAAEVAPAGNPLYTGPVAS